MAFRDLIPWNRGQDVTVRRSEETNPFAALHREMDRMFDEVFHGFDLSSFGNRFDRWHSGWNGWPQ
jgi:HSP20 family protein